MKRVLSILLSVSLIVTCSFGVSMSVSAGNSPMIVVSSESASKGAIKDVTISVKNNPGIASLRLSVSFPDDLTLVSFGNDGVDDQENTITKWVEYSVGSGMANQPQLSSSPIRLNWFNGSENVTGDFVFATLRFKVADDAEEGDKPIVVSYTNGTVGDSEVVDIFKLVEDDKGLLSKTEAVDFAIENGGINVTTAPDYIVGDLDGDGDVTSDDAIYLLYYTLFPDDYPLN